MGSHNRRLSTYHPLKTISDKHALEQIHTARSSRALLLAHMSDDDQAANWRSRLNLLEEQCQEYIHSDNPDDHDRKRGNFKNTTYIQPLKDICSVIREIKSSNHPDTEEILDDAANTLDTVVTLADDLKDTERLKSFAHTEDAPPIEDPLNDTWRA